ncbi:aspartate aminotransferase family protein [Sporolactobacillus sp. CPB3-1]|uniref:Aspartate aminotransferase family protein n=1 Tax=Sporolactobacillus mangiferae TaxID=2940498 RepID=A0ABT0M8K7_9BACL|nr:aspartate aminotransferase family protein [Sporolactobacillus mangiferae]MCL1631199.1 aspartate aminotransferase family protein [Sporolactobacillus mangiferae]
MPEKSMYQQALDLFPPVALRATQLGVVKGEGAYVWDENGKKYIDFASGVAVVNCGHNHPYVVEKVKEQIDELIHGGHNVVYYPSYIKLAEKILGHVGRDYKIYFSNSGAEANEAAIKLAKQVTHRPGIISFKHSFHGRTLATTTLTASNAKYRRNYEGLLPSVYYADFPYATRSGLSEKAEVERCLRSIDEIFHDLIEPEQVACMILEPIQGEGGYIVPPKSFLQAVRKICDDHGILLIFDEVQTGFGRTGKIFAYENFDVKPDIMSLAKAIANGFPLSAIVARRDLMDQWPAGTHGGTFGGNPVACAAGVAVFELLEAGLADHAAEIGAYFKQKLLELTEKHDEILEVRGLGLMIGIEFVDRSGRPDGAIVTAIRKNALEKGLILLNCGVDHNVIRFIPPLIVTRDQIDAAFAIFKDSVEEALHEAAQKK